MAKAKSKPRGANKYTPPAKSGAPGWIWLVAGIVIGSFIMFLMKLEPKKDIRNQPPAKTVEAKDNTNIGSKPKFEFPQILAGNDVPQQPLTQEQQKKLDGERAAALLEGKTPPAIPAPVQQQVSPAPQRTSPPPTTASQPAQPPVAQAAKPTQVAAITPPTSMNFFLQVGSYPTKNGAESIRAQVIMTGQNARLESTNTNNKTWYRVLVGPFKTKDEATKAQKQLANNGFSRTLLVPRKTQ